VELNSLIVEIHQGELAMKKVFLCCLFAVAFCGAQAFAAGGQLSLYGGYLNPGDLNLNNVQGSLNLRGTSLYGARAEVDFLKIFGIEQNFGFSPRMFNSALFPDEASDVRGFFYSTNFVVNVPLSRFVPYVTAGVGAIKPWGSPLTTFDATFAGNYGGGIKLNRLIGPVGLRFDVRGWRTADVMGQGGVNLFESSGGITFSWGGKK
jgi:hypothetical protein